VAIAYNIRLDGLNALDRLRVKVAQVPGVLGEFGDGYRARHGQAMEAVKFSSGAVLFRGEIPWPAPKDQYTRKTDGAVIPPWGGVARLDGDGSVKAKKRPSGQRVEAGSTMMALHDDGGHRSDAIRVSDSAIRG